MTRRKSRKFPLRQERSIFERVSFLLDKVPTDLDQLSTKKVQVLQNWAQCCHEVLCELQQTEERLQKTVTLFKQFHHCEISLETRKNGTSLWTKLGIGEVAHEISELEHRKTELWQRLCRYRRDESNIETLYTELSSIQRLVSQTKERIHLVGQSIPRAQRYWQDRERKAQENLLLKQQREEEHKRKEQERERLRHEREQQLKEKERQKQERERALAAAYLERTRDLADSVKRELRRQITSQIYCPYCTSPLGNNPHADHIYPVAKGGLSTIKNMVYVCVNCNSRKRDMTLREFIIKCELERGLIERTLTMLDKEF